ncbi:MAG: DDE transposase [archaeon]|nr:DDE transposase [archaeon]
MFLENTNHLQTTMFGIESQLSPQQLKKLHISKEYLFYKIIFCQINEIDFKLLYTEFGSPNTPVNMLISALILQNNNGWTHEELFERINFDILTRTALGLHSLDSSSFCPATYYNFRNRLLSHHLKTGENLVELVFDKLTEKQLKELKIKTNIQRTDSFQALSNIREYSRIQLLVETLIRLNRILTDKDKKYYMDTLNSYCKKTSSKFVYNLKRDEIPHKLEEIANVYHKLYTSLKSDYGETEIFKIFERVYTEHFRIVDEKIVIKLPKELTSNCLQSPDDLDATFRKKNEKKNRGQVVNIVETANPENEINLILDTDIQANNIDDSTILNNRLNHIKEKTPDLEELHTDGAYGSAGNDNIMDEENIIHVQTAVRGRKAEVEIKIDKDDSGEYIVSCPKQQADIKKTNNKFQACFNKDICDSCNNCKECPTVKCKDSRKLYFDYQDYKKNKRNRNIDNVSEEKKKIRPNVEASVKEFTKAYNHKGKLKIRGKFSTLLFAFGMSIAINFGRIYRYVKKDFKKGDCMPSIYTIYSLCKYLLAFVRDIISKMNQFGKNKYHLVPFCQFGTF